MFTGFHETALNGKFIGYFVSTIYSDDKLLVSEDKLELSSAISTIHCKMFTFKMSHLNEYIVYFF